MNKIKDYYNSLLPDSRYVIVFMGAFIIFVMCSPLLIIVHEGAHVISAIMLNFKVTSITIEPFYGVVNFLFDPEKHTLLDVGLVALSGGVAETVLLLLISRVTVPQIKFFAIVSLTYAIGESYLTVCMISARLVNEIFAYRLYLDIVMTLGVVVYVLAILIDMYRKSEDWDIEIGLRDVQRVYVYDIEERNVR